MRLIYHSFGDGSDAISPFDSSILTIAKNNCLKLVCPYLSLSYLERLISVASSWCLITDLEEWLNSLPKTQLYMAHDFILKNHKNIRNYNGIHAKVALSCRGALLGSANFTDAGILRRVEMAMYIDDTVFLNELQQWFCNCWNAANQINTNQVDSIIRSIVEISRDRPKPFYVQQDSPGIYKRRARLEPLAVPFSEHPSMRQRARLVDRFSVIGNRQWIEQYYDIMEALIENLGIKDTDRRLCLSISKQRNGWTLPLTINNRYILAIYQKRNELMLGVLWQGGPLEQGIQSRVIRATNFDPLRGENSDEVPNFLYLSGPDVLQDLLNNQQLADGWLQAIGHELERAEASPYRKYHSSLSYRMAVDAAYRYQLLDEAY
jgi:hypothetical protein